MESTRVKSFRSKSRASSIRSSSSSTSSKRIIDSKLKLELAKLKLKQIEESQVYERKQEALKRQAEIQEEEFKRQAEIQEEEFKRQAELKELELKRQEEELKRRAEIQQQELMRQAEMQQQELMRQAELQNTKHEIQRAQVESAVLEAASQHGDDFNGERVSDVDSNISHKSDIDTSAPPVTPNVNVIPKFDPDATAFIPTSIQLTSAESVAQPQVIANIANMSYSNAFSNQPVTSVNMPGHLPHQPVTSVMETTYHLPTSIKDGNLYGHLPPQQVPNRKSLSYQLPPSAANVSYLPQSLQQSNVCAAQDSYSSRPNLTAQPSLSPTDVLANILSLPKAELLEFNGEAKHYQSFITNFKSHIDSKLNDPSVKLTYLIQYCTGEAKRLIRNCVLMPSSQGYEAALKLLKEHCGQNHLIARAHIDGLIHGPQVKANDTDGLVKLSREVIDCQIVLSQLSFTSDMDASETIWSIAKRLPNHLHAKWVEQAADILKAREPRYNDICRFIEARARVGATVYGRKYAEMLKSKVSNQRPKVLQKGNNLATLSTQVDVNKDGRSGQARSGLKSYVHSDSRAAQSGTTDVIEKCPMCSLSNHRIYKCIKFIKLPVDERLKFVQCTKLCFRCLKAGHFSKDCHMNCTKCQRRHNVLLHDNRPDDQATAQAGNQEGNRDSEVSSNPVKINNIRNPSKTKICLGIIPVKIKGNGISVQTYALLDSGSNATLIKRNLANSLKLKGMTKSFSVQTLSGKSLEKNQQEVSIIVSNQNEDNQVSIKALTVDTLNIQLSCAARPEDITKYSHLQGVKLPSIEEGQVGLLIGTNSPEMHWSLEERRGKRGEPVARKTLLGWTVIGPVSSDPTPTTDGYDVNLIQIDSLQDQLNRQWEFDFQDFSSDKSTVSQDDKESLQVMQQSCELVNGKYQVAVPWKYNPSKLPNNKKLAEIRLKYLKRRLTGDEDLHRQYTNTVETYIKDGHAKKLSEEEANAVTSQWYLPHHPVFKRSNPSKCRVVFDCAAKYKGVSLNEALYQGPNFLNNLSGVLIRFRKEPIAVVADIEAMFHQCFVTKPDQEFLRFLWWEDGDLSADAKVYAMLVHLFGAKSSPSVANFCIHKTCEDHKAEFSEDTIHTVRRSFYMDDLLKSVKTIDEAISLINELKTLLKMGGFNLTKWMSTHREVISSVPEIERAKSLKNVNISEVSLPQEPTLGLQWDVEADSFTFDIQIKEKPLTRRGLLSMTASLFDPLGFLCPVTLIPKLIQQKLCLAKLEWDDEIPSQEAEKFFKWHKSLSSLCNISIKRCFKSEFMGDPQHTELHILCDASEYAYGSVAYLKLYNSKESSVQMIMGKSRVSPLKAITIPRLELTAATVGAKMYQFLLEESDMKFDKVFFWTDSLTVLKYLVNTSTRFKRFVSNRIQVIQDLTNVSDWRYIPTRLNTADLASRGIELEEKKKLSLWFHGPEFLSSSNDYEMISKLNKCEDLNEELEVKHSFALEVITEVDSLLTHFSHYDKLLKSVAWLHKFFNYLKLKSKGEALSNLSKELQVSDMQAAETQIIRYSQATEFSQEFKNVLKGKPVSGSSVLSGLCPLEENNLLKVGSRLQDSESDVNKKPIILPNNNVSMLIIKEAHEKNGHTGVNHTLSIVRQKYFLLKGYQTVKKVINSCFKCNKAHKKPCNQKMGDLPKERTAVDDPPFTAIGVDYFGPLLVKYGRGTVKRYGCLITCLSTRAIHLEVASSLDTDSFLMAFHRFIARRGKPTKVYSDNGRNFVGAERELREAVQGLNSKKVKDVMLLEAIDWHFITPHTPHAGGVWERLVRSVKSVLKALVKQQLLSDEQLVTFMCETEKILNDRPLTTVSSDAKDSEPLTPNHLLLLRRNPCTPTPMCGSNYIQRRWNVIHQIANKFYSRFVAEYLPLLHQRPKWQNITENIKVNDIVLVLDENLPRGEWPLGLVNQVTYGRDGLVRSAQVKVGQSVKTRPINKLVLLEHHDH